MSLPAERPPHAGNNTVWCVGLSCTVAPATGTGKSLTAEEVCSRTALRHVDVGQLAKQQNLFDGWDEQYQCPVLDEDKVATPPRDGRVASAMKGICCHVCRWWMSWRR